MSHCDMLRHVLQLKCCIATYLKRGERDKGTKKGSRIATPIFEVPASRGPNHVFRQLGVGCGPILICAVGGVWFGLRE